MYGRFVRHGVFAISNQVKGECRKQNYLHYAEPPPFLCKDTNFEANYNRVKLHNT